MFDCDGGWTTSIHFKEQFVSTPEMKICQEIICKIFSHADGTERIGGAIIRRGELHESLIFFDFWDSQSLSLRKLEIAASFADFTNGPSAW